MRDQEQFRAAVATWAAGGTGAGAAAVAATELARTGVRTVLLVEGVSDLSAVEALAGRYGRDLAAEAVCVVPIGGAMAVRRYLRILGPQGLGLDVRGLCDEAEEGHVRRGLAQAGFGPVPDRSALESLGFRICVADLEDELIRALGTAGVERVLAVEKDLARFRTFQNQPAQREQPVDRQMHRFLGTTSGRKAHYGRALVLALDLDRVPRPLHEVLSGV